MNISVISEWLFHCVPFLPLSNISRQGWQYCTPWRPLVFPLNIRLGQKWWTMAAISGACTIKTLRTQQYASVFVCASQSVCSNQTIPAYYKICHSPTNYEFVMIYSTWGQCYKTFFVRNLLVFIISQCLSLASFSSLV